jgi:2-methylcitrate dehydratase
MDTTAEKFATYTAALSYDDLGARAVHSAKRSIIDSIGCALGAYNAEPVRAVCAMAAQLSAAKPATLIGTRIKSSPEMAGFANSTMIRYLDFSDDYFGGAGMQAGPHPSDNIGSVLAATESSGGSGKTFILGTVVAYEVCAQLVDHVTLGRNGWDYPIYHSAATALGAGKVLGLTQPQLRHALGLALVANVCLRETRKGELSIWKGLAGPNGSRNGLFAALLAQIGITGPGEPFEGNAGLMKQLDVPFTLGKLGGNGIPFKVEGMFFKYLPVMYSVQLPVMAAMKLRKKINLDDVVSLVGYVDAHVSRNDAFSVGRWDPKTRETADHSGPYLMGAALVDGEISEATMTPQRYRDPYILSLIKKIRVEEDPAYTAARPGTLNCRLEATLKSGAVVSVHEINPKGHPANPLSDTEIEEKFLKQVGELLPPQQSRALLDAMWKLEQIENLSKLFELMVIPASHRKMINQNDRDHA